MTRRKKPAPVKAVRAAAPEFIAFEIGVNPYEDSSGFRLIVKAQLQTDGEFVRRISIAHGEQQSLWMDPEEWPALRDAVDRALATVFGEKKKP